MTEFENWHKLKQDIHSSKSRIHFRQDEIWFVSIGKNIGYEVFGKGSLEKSVFEHLEKAFVEFFKLTSP